MDYNFENQIIRVFQSTQNSYKFYWWYSILHLIKEKKVKTLNFDEIAIQMIVFSWYPVNFYKLSLGKQDQISNHIRELKNNFNDLNDGIKEEDLFSFLHLNIENEKVRDILNKLVRYVPFRFIRPWYQETTGIKDGIVHQQILILQNSGKHLPPYTIDLINKEIKVNSHWFNWLYSNIKIIESFTIFELFKYVEKNNPYVTNISLKLFKPQTRKLTEPTNLWKNFIEINGIDTMSVFEKKPLSSIDKISIDHYLPWSFVTHDKLWNLHPMENDVNSSKSNKIAENKYLKDFTKIQFNFVRYISKLNPKYLEDYFLLFSISKMELLQMSGFRFSELLKKKITLDTELAVNQGYFTKWSYVDHH
jgi:hypothetical protein